MQALPRNETLALTALTTATLHREAKHPAFPAFRKAYDQALTTYRSNCDRTLTATSDPKAREEAYFIAKSILNDEIISGVATHLSSPGDRRKTSLQGYRYYGLDRRNQEA
jgi:hypothetical protein